MKDVVTLDGPAGCGKSTVAKILSRELSYNQVDSGALYRMVTFLALEFIEKQGGTVQDVVLTEDFQDYLRNSAPEVAFQNGHQQIKVAGRLLEDELRTPQITSHIKPVADDRKIRDYVNSVIRQLGEEYPLVADGRDMGTVVFPDSTHKFFLTASLEERSRRRFEEFKARHPDIDLETVMQEIARRDQDDENREFGNLKPAHDAIILDTTHLEINAVVQTVLHRIKN